MRLRFWLAAIPLGVIIALMLWWQARGGKQQVAATPVPPGRVTTVNPVCGGAAPLVAGPFRGLPGGRPAQVMVRVVSACGNRTAEIEVETRRNQWTPVREHVPRLAGALLNPPEVGGWYVLAVPNGNHIRLSCAAGEGVCTFEITDITQQANVTFPVVPAANPQSPGCSGAQGDPRLLNLSERAINVEVTFTSLCTNPPQNLPQPATIHRIPARPPLVPGGPLLPGLPNIGVNPAPPPPPGQPAQPTQWKGQLEAGYSLRASCTGTQGACTFSVVAKG